MWTKTGQADQTSRTCPEKAAPLETRIQARRIKGFSEFISRSKKPKLKVYERQHLKNYLPREG
jgi:hypothetical protein